MTEKDRFIALSALAFIAHTVGFERVGISEEQGEELTAQMADILYYFYTDEDFAEFATEIAQELLDNLLKGSEEPSYS